ncbi:MAG: DUF924 family protein [Hyphomicrobiaceae bacterium]
MTTLAAVPPTRAGCPPWASAVLSFWFDELGPGRWFASSDETDRLVRQRFQTLHGELAAAPLATLLASAETVLAAVIVLDQFPRNMHRGEAAAFATDANARALADAAIARGFDTSLDKHGRLFLYLPFEHSENLPDQERAVALISALGDATLTDYAVRHRDVIMRFGRFPHRNSALGRPSTDEEAAFLTQPGSRF